MRLPRGISFLVLLALAGCIEQPVEPPAPPLEVSVGPTEPVRPPRPPRKPPVPSAEAAPSEPAPTEVARLEPAVPSPSEPDRVSPPDAPAAASPPPAEPINAEKLIGLDQPQMRSLLGAPNTRAEAAPATIWRYNGRNCELAIYFYLDLQSQVMRALHYEVTPHDSSEHPGSRCLGDLVSAHQANAAASAGADHPR
jgi:hypothetical protein